MNKIHCVHFLRIDVDFNSLQATWIRNSLLRALRDTVQLDTRQTTENFVYAYPTISQLAVLLYSLARGKLDAVHIEPDSRINAMHAMVKKYSKGLSTSTGGMPPPATSGKIVLLTGTTGSLGSHILASLVSGYQRRPYLRCEQAGEICTIRQATGSICFPWPQCWPVRLR